MTENELEAAVCLFMKNKGWRRFRNQIGVYKQGNRTMRIGTPGFPDWTFRRSTGIIGLVRICHVEIKAEGGKPSKKQLEQIALLNHLGEPAIWIDNIEEFTKWYTYWFSLRPQSLV